MFSIRKLGTTIATAGSLLALAAGSAFALDGGVKVECNGACGSVNLGQVCDSVAWQSTPYAIACDDTSAVQMSGSWGCGGGTCNTYGDMRRGDPVSAYCDDGWGFDAVVMCRW